jgi:hypothetical protein
MISLSRAPSQVSVFFFVFALHAQPVVAEKINSKQCPARSKRQTARGGGLSSIFGLTLQLHSAGAHTGWSLAWLLLKINNTYAAAFVRPS